MDEGGTLFVDEALRGTSTVMLLILKSVPYGWMVKWRWERWRGKLLAAGSCALACLELDRTGDSLEAGHMIKPGYDDG